MLEDILGIMSPMTQLVVAVAVLVAIACVPLWMVLRHRRLRCEQRHAERMKALEMGCPLSTLDPPKLYFSAARG